MIECANNISKQEPTVVESMIEAFESMREMVANMRKLRYRETPLAPMEPVVLKTKSYEMVIIHPASLHAFLARFKMTNSQLAFVGLSPATDAEWMEWGKELVEQMSNQKSAKS